MLNNYQELGNVPVNGDRNDRQSYTPIDDPITRAINGDTPEGFLPASVRWTIQAACCLTCIGGCLYTIPRTFTVDRGRVALTWDNGTPVIYGEGIHTILSPFHSFDKFIDINAKEVELGSAYHLVRVDNTEVGIKYDDHGRLHILPPGRHVIDKTTERFGGFLSTQVQHCEFTFDIETRDNVPLKVKGAIQFKIENPQTVKTTFDKDLAIVIRERAELTLCSIFRDHNFGEIRSLSYKVDAAPGSADRRDEASSSSASSSPSGLSQISSDFMRQLAQNLQASGITVVNTGITSYDILDKRILEQLGKAAGTRANAEADLSVANQKAKLVAIEAEAEGKKKQALLAAETEAKAKQILALADAEAKAEVIKAKAEAEASLLRAKSDAQSVKAFAETTGVNSEKALELWTQRKIAEQANFALVPGSGNLFQMPPITAATTNNNSSTNNNSFTK